jgi:aminopeptidase N
VGPKVLEFFEQYYNIKFPLPKQDMIAIPDFSAGAMENWGLITYREVALLYEPGMSSLSDREYVATVIAHELAHQWFGDLVTMEWWDG